VGYGLPSMSSFRRALFATLAALAVAACFPAFDFGESAVGADGGPGGPDATLDHESPVGDANVGSDGATSTGPDGNAPFGDAGDGSTARGPFDASDMIAIEAGTFDFLNYGNAVSATISHDFLIDRYEVTNARFAAWVDAGQNPPCQTGTCSLDTGGPYASAMTWDSAWNVYVGETGYTDDSACNAAGNASAVVPDWTVDGGSAFPVSCVNWYQAASFCAFEGKRLLTETEWAYVASGRGAGRTYPWGHSPPGAACDQAIWSYYDAGLNSCDWPVNVGTASNGGSLDGVLDMSGSLFEWVWDWYDPIGAYTGGTDYTGAVEDSGARVDRGGSWSSLESELTTTNRDTTGPNYSFEDLGIRCARSL
jgi:sulfatase modifying factor 1